MKNNVKRIMTFFLCLVCFVGIVSCGGPMPETDIPKADDTPVEDITPLPEEEPTEITAKEAYNLLYDELVKYMAISARDDVAYLSVETAKSITSEMSYKEIINKLGNPHFMGFAMAPSGIKAKTQNNIYIVEDGTVLYLAKNSTGDYGEEVSLLAPNDLVSRLKIDWEQSLTVEADPQITYEKLYEDMADRQYMHISDRTDFVDAKLAKHIPLVDYCSPLGLTVDEMYDKLGEPHFMQAEEVRPPNLSGGDRQTFYTYILSDGTTLLFESGYNATYVGFPIHYTVEEALNYYSRAMYY